MAAVILAAVISEVMLAVAVLVWRRRGGSEMVAGRRQGSHVSLNGCNLRWRLVENFDILEKEGDERGEIKISWFTVSRF